MAPEVAEVLKTARSLKRGQIADLTYQLLRMLDDESPAVDQLSVDEAWRAEFRRRIDDIESGKVELVSHEGTVAEARSLLAARRK